MTTNRLYNYALLNELKQSSGNSFSQIFSLFAKPIMEDMVKGDQFNTKVFIEEMKNRYNIEWNDNIVNIMVSNFVKDGLLFKRRIDGKNIYFYNADPSMDDLKTASEESVNIVIKEFKKFISVNPNIFLNSKTDDELLKILTDYLINSDWIDGYDVCANKNFLNDEYACARFIGSIEDKNILQIISELSGSIKIGSLLEELSKPTTKRSDFSDKNIFLDNTLLLSYLGLCGNLEESNASNLITRLKSNGANICIYSHTYEEGLHALDTILKSDNGYGLTWNAINNHEITREYVEMIFRNFGEEIGKKSVSIIETDVKKEKTSPYFADIFSQMNFHYNMYRDTTMDRTREILSVLYIFHENSIKRTPDILMQPNIFLTTNQEFVYAVSRYMTESDNTGYNPSMFSNPFILSGKFEFLLWLSDGNYDQVSRIATIQLIHQADKIRRLRPEIFRIAREKVSKSLNRMDSEKLEAMLQEPRYKQALADSTSNNIENIKTMTHAQIMEVMDRENKKETHALKISYGKKLKAKNDEVEQLQSSILLQKLEEESRVQTIMTIHSQWGQKITARCYVSIEWLVVLLTIGAIILPVGLEWFSVPVFVGSVIIAVIGLVFYLFSRYKIRIYITKKIESIFRKRVLKKIKTDIDISGLSKIFCDLNYNKRINWETFTILQNQRLLPITTDVSKELAN